MVQGKRGKNMAIAGGMTVAYRCRVIDNRLIQTSTTYPSWMCIDAPQAMESLANGGTVVVSGADKEALNRLLRDAGVALSN